MHAPMNSRERVGFNINFYTFTLNPREEMRRNSREVKTDGRTKEFYTILQEVDDRIWAWMLAYKYAAIAEWL